VSKNRLESLASATKGEIEGIVEEIESGEFVGRSQRNTGRTSEGARPYILNSDIIIPGLKQLNNIISGFANNFNAILQDINNGDSTDLKPVLRTLINELEELYRSMDK